MKFLSHEPIANGTFNESFNSATPTMEPWRPHLGNSIDLLGLVLARLESDYTAQHTKMRKPFNAAAVVT